VLAHAHEAAAAGIGSDGLMLLMALLPILLLATIAIVSIAARRGWLGDARRALDISAPLTVLAATLSIAAGGIHFAVVQEHLNEDVAAAIFFVALAWFQVIWAMAYLLRPNDRLRALAIVVNTATVAIWVVSRTTGLPIGASPWEPEAIGLADLLSSSFEIILVALLAGSLMPRVARHLSGYSVPLEKAYVLTSFGILVVASLTGLALLGSPAG
jgi:hypothetical protein